MSSTSEKLIADFKLERFELSNIYERLFELCKKCEDIFSFCRQFLQKIEEGIIIFNDSLGHQENV